MANNPPEEWLKLKMRQAGMSSAKPPQPKIAGDRETVRKRLRWLGRKGTDSEVDRYWSPGGEK